jgi:hypothetical protein
MLSCPRPDRAVLRHLIRKSFRYLLCVEAASRLTCIVAYSSKNRFALEAADNGLMAPELAAGVARARGAKRGVVRLGHWLTVEQAERPAWVHFRT